MTQVIGLTGGIGSGKSTVSRFLADLGAVIIDADKIGHEVYLPGTNTWRELVKIFGSRILAADKAIDRKKLGAIVFGNEEELKRLNAIIHPQITEIIKKQIDDYRRKGTPVIVLDAPVLFEANAKNLVDEVWVVVSNEDNVIKRAAARTGLTEEQIRSRIRSQLSNEERIKHARVVIHNDGTAEDLRKKVQELWQQLKT
ncbi:MAG: dephospho-CoA kinase [Dehalococcoidales bacterium]